MFTKEDYRGDESDQKIVVGVTKDVQIASPITLSITPLTINEAITSGDPVPFSVPEHNPYSPKRASNVTLKSLKVRVNLLVLHQ